MLNTGTQMNRVKVVSDGNRLLWSNKRCWNWNRSWNTDAGTQMLEHRCWNTNAETQMQKHNAETELELMLKHNAVTAETQWAGTYAETQGWNSC
jgi:hypothetical protein